MMELVVLVLLRFYASIHSTTATHCSACWRGEGRPFPFCFLFAAGSLLFVLAAAFLFFLEMNRL